MEITMSDENTFLSLRRQGYRLTPQRRIILRILRQCGSHLTPVEIVRLAQQEMPGMTEATVYRSLSFLAENGLALAAHIGGGQLAYEIADHAHHHLICRECGESLEIDHDLLDELYDKLFTHTGYKIDSLHMTFFGTCPECQI